SLRRRKHVSPRSLVKADEHPSARCLRFSPVMLQPLYCLSLPRCSPRERQYLAPISDVIRCVHWKRYSFAGFFTRIILRVVSSGYQELKNFSHAASSNFENGVISVLARPAICCVCGQSLAHSMW